MCQSVEEILRKLKSGLIVAELQGKPQVRLLLFEKPDEPVLKFHIYKEKNHIRPHFHIKWKNEFSASIAIDRVELLEGDIPNRYMKYAISWATENRQYLLEQWGKAQRGEQPQRYEV